MTQITYVQRNGDRLTLDAADEASVMFTAVQNGVPGIVAECGGVLSCATCHVYVDEGWSEKVGPAGRDEVEMLELTAAERRPTSRLGCQIKIRPELDGLVVHIPEAQ